jgi:hypothetical protein
VKGRDFEKKERRLELVTTHEVGVLSRTRWQLCLTSLFKSLTLRVFIATSNRIAVSTSHSNPINLYHQSNVTVKIHFLQKWQQSSPRLEKNMLLFKFVIVATSLLVSFCAAQLRIQLREKDFSPANDGRNTTLKQRLLSKRKNNAPTLFLNFSNTQLKTNPHLFSGCQGPTS